MFCISDFPLVLSSYYFSIERQNQFYYSKHKYDLRYETLSKQGTDNDNLDFASVAIKPQH